jgi:flagellar hook-associated protein 2
MVGLTSAVGTISSAGIGSGLDVNNIVTQLMAVERKPLERLQTTATTLQTQLSRFGPAAVAGLRTAGRRQAAVRGRLLQAQQRRLQRPGSVSAGTTTKAVPGSMPSR